VGQGSDDRLLLILSVIVLAMPARFEGPILVTITQRHRVTLSDVVGFIPLSVGWLAWVVAIWRRRWRVEAAISASHGAATDSAFVGGLGVGLVIATDRTSSWWLVLGAALRTSVALGAVPIVSRRDQPASEKPLGSRHAAVAAMIGRHPGPADPVPGRGAPERQRRPRGEEALGVQRDRFQTLNKGSAERGRSGPWAIDQASWIGQGVPEHGTGPGGSVGWRR
jgi:hypothetical protein